MVNEQYFAHKSPNAKKKEAHNHPCLNIVKRCPQGVDNLFFIQQQRQKYVYKHPKS